MPRIARPNLLPFSHFSNHKGGIYLKKILALSLITFMLFIGFFPLLGVSAHPYTYDNVVVTDQVSNNGLLYEDMNVGYDPLNFKNGVVYLKNGTQLYSWTSQQGFVHLTTFNATIKALDFSGSNIVITTGQYVCISTNGINWTVALTLSTGTVGWRMATSGNSVFVGEYGSVNRSKLWASHSNGAIGSWSVAMLTHDGAAGTTHHIHTLEVDPYTNHIYVACGDTNDNIFRSTDGGLSFQMWGLQFQPTSITFDSQRIYFGDDPNSRVYVYERSSNFMDVAAKFDTPGAPVWDMLTGADEVIYASTYTQGIAGRNSGIYISVDGTDWYKLLAFADGPVDAGSQYLVGPVDGYIWLRDANDNTTRINDLTEAQATSLIYSRQYALGEVYTYLPGKYAYDGDDAWISFAQDPIENAQIIFDNVQANNMLGAHNSGFEEDEVWVGATDWYLIAAAHQTNNISASQASIGHESDRSAYIRTFNSSVNHGYIECVGFNDAANPIPAGTRVTASFYYMNTCTDTDLIADSALMDPTIRSTQVDGGTELISVTVGTLPTYKDTGGLWNRYVLTGVLAEPSTTLKFRVTYYGQSDSYIDNVQLQTGTVTPYIEGNHDSTNITATIGDNTYVANLASPTIIDIDGVLSGNIPISFNINGSRAVSWSITGDRIAHVDECSIDQINETYGMIWGNWNGANITVYSTVVLDMGDFYLTVLPDGVATISNISIPGFSGEHGEIIVSFTGEGSYKCAILSDELDTQVRIISNDRSLVRSLGNLFSVSDGFVTIEVHDPLSAPISMLFIIIPLVMIASIIPMIMGLGKKLH